MKDHFEYKGYLGSAEADVEGRLFVGKLMYIRDVIAYAAEDFVGLEKAFQHAVDDYLQTCAELGKEPDVPCKGTFNVRIGPELHRRVALAARKNQVGLNEFIRDALVIAVCEQQRVEHIHKGEFNVVLTYEDKVLNVSTPPSGAFNWKGPIYATQ